MIREEFAPGTEFWCNERLWRCTDVGSRAVVAIQLNPELLTHDPSWYNGPPYAVAELVFDEYDQQSCTLKREEQ